VSGLVCLLGSALTTDVMATKTPAFLWMAFALLGWTALQATPLPCSFVETIAPGAAASARAAQVVLASKAAISCTLSYDPGATRAEIVKGVAVVSTLMAAWILGAGGGRRIVLWSLACASLAMCVVAVAHPVLGLKGVFGVYSPPFLWHPWLQAPLMNPNNLGAFAALGAPLFIALTQRDERREVRWLGYIATVITSVTAVLSLSRGAVGQLVGSLLVMICLVYFSGKRAAPSAASTWLSKRLGLVVALAVAAAILAYIAGSALPRELASGDLSKLALVGRAFSFAAQHPWIGVGRGAFSSTFVALEGRTWRFVYAENFLAQWASEWGIPFTLAWLAVVATALLRRTRRLRSLTLMGALTALAGLCAQNLVDLGFEILGIAVAAAALLAVVLAPDRVAKEPASGPMQLRVSVSLMLLAGTVAVASLAPDLDRSSVASLGADMRASLAEHRRPRFREALERAVSLHPSEPLFPVLAATEALTHGDPAAPRWLNRAMTVAPNWGAPHVLAFRWLWQRGLRSQALLELRAAAEADPNPALIGQPLCMVTQLSGEHALAVAPRGAARRAVLEMAAGCVPADHASAGAIDAVLLAEFPDNALAQERTAVRLSREGRLYEALTMFADLLKRHPDYDSARVQRADVLRRAERFQELVEQVERDLLVAQEDTKPELLSAQALAFARLGDTTGVERAVAAYRRLRSGSAAGLAESFALDGQLQMLLGNLGHALAAFREAYRINNDVTHVAAVAHIARRMGNRPQAIWAYMQLCEREPRGTTHCAERDRLLSGGAFDVR
jgi:hypothetical protein